MNVKDQAKQYNADLALVKHQLFAVQKFDHSFLRKSRIAALQDRINTLETLVALCSADDAQEVEDLTGIA